MFCEFNFPFFLPVLLERFIHARYTLDIQHNYVFVKHDIYWVESSFVTVACNVTMPISVIWPVGITSMHDLTSKGYEVHLHVQKDIFSAIIFI